MNVKHFALVFLAEVDIQGKFVDAGDDPCFSNPPTWGICRPDIRNETGLVPGSNLLFIARVFERQIPKYYLKGFFRVSEKIDVVSAFRAFRQRRNIIISTSKRRVANEKWANKRWEDVCSETYQKIPKFLRCLKHNGTTYYQNDQDNHQIDNWKCRRVYNCNIKSFEKCVLEGQCLKESRSLKKNYIVGDDFQEWDHLKVEWKSIASLIGKSSDLMVGNRHPEIELSIEEFLIVKTHMEGIQDQVL